MIDFEYEIKYFILKFKDNDRATYTGVLPMRYIQKNFEYK